MANPREPFEPDTIYHVYNHGNGNELIFRESENYRFFLKQFKIYISHIAWIYAYCLMPNHFHFLLRIKSEDILVEHFKEKYPDKVMFETGGRSASQKDIADLSGLISKLISNQFKKLPNHLTRCITAGAASFLTISSVFLFVMTIISQI